MGNHGSTDAVIRKTGGGGPGPNHGIRKVRGIYRCLKKRSPNTISAIMTTSIWMRKETYFHHLAPKGISHLCAMWTGIRAGLAPVPYITFSAVIAPGDSREFHLPTDGIFRWIILQICSHTTAHFESAVAQIIPTTPRAWSEHCVFEEIVALAKRFNSW